MAEISRVHTSPRSQQRNANPSLALKSRNRQRVETASNLRDIVHVKDTAGHEDLTESIIGCGIRVHASWGPGLLESVYKECLLIELEDAGHRVDTVRRLQLV